MKIIVVGATGTIGKRVVKALSGRHEIIKISHSAGDVQVDLAVPDSIKNMYSAAGMPAEETAMAYVESVEGQYNGEVLDVRQVG